MIFSSEYKNDDGISFWSKTEIWGEKIEDGIEMKIIQSKMSFDAILVESIVLWWKIEKKTEQVHPYDC